MELSHGCFRVNRLLSFHDRRVRHVRSSLSAGVVKKTVAVILEKHRIQLNKNIPVLSLMKSNCLDILSKKSEQIHLDHFVQQQVPLFFFSFFRID